MLATLESLSSETRVRVRVCRVFCATPLEKNAFMIVNRHVPLHPPYSRLCFRNETLAKVSELCDVSYPLG